MPVLDSSVDIKDMEMVSNVNVLETFKLCNQEDNLLHLEVKEKISKLLIAKINEFLKIFLFLCLYIFQETIFLGIFGTLL